MNLFDLIKRLISIFRGGESSWLTLCTLKLRGNKLQIADRQFAGVEDEGVVASVSPGNYVVEYCLDEEGDISRLRAYLRGTDGVLGKVIGEVSVDFGYVAVADCNTLEAAERNDEDAYQDWIESLMDLEKSAGLARCKLADSTIAYVESGYGDGTYDVRRLVSDEQVVGLEVSFLPRSL